MKLSILNDSFSVVKLPPTADIPAWAMHGEFFSITRTAEELSIVCPSACLQEPLELAAAEHDWSCIKVEGVLDFGLTGILASLANPLAENGISLFAISTYNTDYLLVKSHVLDQARWVLEQAGHDVIG